MDRFSIPVLAALFAFAGTMHFIVPGAFASIMPRWIPAPLALVYISGVAEVAGGLGLLVRRTRVAAGWALLALLVAVFPANVQMLLDARSQDTSSWYQAVLWARLPLQPLLIWWVWRSALKNERVR